jgi:hypothetical protein
VPRPARRTVVTIAALTAAAALLAVAVTIPAQAAPDRALACASCHSGTPSGSVTAVPGATTLPPGAAYTVDVLVGLGAGGRSGYRLAASDAGGATGAWLPVFGGPGVQTSWVLGMTAPAVAGTYHYKVFGVKGYPGQTSSATYSITVATPEPSPSPTTTPSPTPTPTPDTIRPTVAAPAKASVVKGKKATLRYRVDDAEPNLGTASALITIRDRRGKVVKTLRPGAVTVNTPQRATFVCRLARGTYTFSVTATDAAGNRSSNTAVNRLTVK